ncbi:MAG: 50S ribosomal protein L17 [Candidatus Paceibacterota bacterium]|jgi:large subunit ribosomal protein L17
MRHHNNKRKFHREQNQRNALLISLASNLILRGKIRTTEAKAKEVRPFVEKLLTKARLGTLASFRLVSARLRSAETAKILAEKIAPKFKSRPGGYTRITKLVRRSGDASPMAVIEFVETIS